MGKTLFFALLVAIFLAKSFGDIVYSITYNSYLSPPDRIILLPYGNLKFQSWKSKAFEWQKRGDKLIADGKCTFAFNDQPNKPATLAFLPFRSGILECDVYTRRCGTTFQDVQLVYDPDTQRIKDMMSRMCLTAEPTAEENVYSAQLTVEGCSAKSGLFELQQKGWQGLNSANQCQCRGEL